MLRKSVIVCHLFLLLCCSMLHGQLVGLEMHRGAKRIEIPFERQNNFIVIKVVFAGIFPMRFILDTGAEHTILIKKEVTNLLQIRYERELTIMGTDMSTQIKAYIARKIRLELPNLTLVKDILVLEDDYFRFDQFAGLDVHGIIGSEVFKSHILKIDYEKQLITLYDPSVFSEKDRRRYSEVPISIIRSKPYLVTDATINKDTTVSLKLLLDTGASLALLLHSYTTPGLSPPPKVVKGSIGTGLGGSIEGFLGRIGKIQLGNYVLANPISHFQELYQLSDTSYLNGRNGILGGDILSRFSVIIDFTKEKMYLHPNKSFKDAFEYDKSGLVVIASGLNLNQFTVQEVLDDSPAKEAGLLRGDEILNLNLITVRYYNLAAINRILQGKTGKKIRIVIKRDGQRIVKRFRLRELI